MKRSCLKRGPGCFVFPLNRDGSKLVQVTIAGSKSSGIKAQSVFVQEIFCITN